ncbi:MAG: glycosyltransferase family 4 protein [Flavobacteriales bacterium]
MRIILLADGVFPDCMGGMQKHSTMLLKNLLEQGHQVLLVSFFTDKSIDAPKMLSMLKVNSDLHHRLKLLSIGDPPKFCFPGHYVYESYLFSKSIYNEIKEVVSSYDFVYAQGFTAWYLLKKRCKTPVGINFHGLNMFQKTFGFRPFIEKHILKPFVLKNLKKADFVFSLGGALTNILLKEGVKKEKIITQHNGIDESWIVNEPSQAGNDVTTFLFVGRDDKIKGFEVIRKIVESNFKNLEIKLNVVGIEGVNSEKTTFFGLVKDEQNLKEIYSQSDILLMNSYSEGMPTVILEAMAQGKPIIASDVGAIKELVGEDNGMLFDSGDVNGLISSIFWFHSLDKKKRYHLGENSLIKVKTKFTWRNIVKKSFEMVENKLHEHTKKPDLG